MNSTKLASIGLAAALAAVLPAIPAQATLLTRTFVSSAGSNSNPCTITQPCASFATAYSLTAPNGIISALDPGKYGPLTITGPITINGNGWAAITAPAGGNGITINAGGGDNVALTGLEIDGAGAGYNGIVLNAAGSLTVTNCTLQNFISAFDTTGNGIVIAPSTANLVTFVITNTIVSNNKGFGVVHVPPGGTDSVRGVIDHVVATNNFNGIGINTSASGGQTNVAISNSIVSNNSQYGVYINNGSASLTVAIDTATVSGSGVGIQALGTSKITLGRSVITGSQVGVDNNTSPNTFYTYSDNHIDLNTTDISDSSLMPLGPK
jgi:hypothetical protein